MKNPFSIKVFLDKDLRIKRKEKLEFEESMLDSSEEDASGIETPINAKKIILLEIIIILILGFLASRTAYLQIIKGNEFKNLAEENRIYRKIIVSPRGIILDRNEKILLKNIPSLDVVAVPLNFLSERNELDEEIRFLARILEEKEDKIKDILEPVNKIFTTPILIKENISHDVFLKIESNRNSLPGIETQRRPRREYTDSSLSNILGYTGPLTKEEWQSLGRECKKNCYLLSDVVGKTGIEASYEKELRGVHGEERFEVDSRGDIQKDLGVKNYIPGSNLALNIDLELQKKISEVLSDKLKEKKAAAVVAMNPQNGVVLAILSSPTYDNNLFAKGISEDDYRRLLENEQKPLFNRAIAGTYAPGSVIKPMMATAALEEGIVSRDTIVNSTGGIKIGGQFFKDWKEGGHGPTNIIKAISESVNSYFYTVIGGTEEKKGLGIEKAVKYLKKFGFIAKTGIDIPSEAEGFVATPQWKNNVKKEKWYIGDTYNLSIGQGDFLVTPIQIASYISAIANNGTLFEPQIVSKIISPEGKITTYKTPVVKEKNIASEENLRIVREGMRESVISGAAKGMADLGVSVAGKTGTAEIGKEGKYNSWFASFAPYENPEIVLVVLVEEGEGGNIDALPIAKDILKWYFKK